MHVYIYRGWGYGDLPAPKDFKSLIDSIACQACHPRKDFKSLQRLQSLSTGLRSKETLETSKNLYNSFKNPKGFQRLSRLNNL